VRRLGLGSCGATAHSHRHPLLALASIHLPIFFISPTAISSFSPKFPPLV
jgi:hypothetical protein